MLHLLTRTIYGVSRFWSNENERGDMPHLSRASRSPVERRSRSCDTCLLPPIARLYFLQQVPSSAACFKDSLLQDGTKGLTLIASSATQENTPTIHRRVYSTWSDPAMPARAGKGKSSSPTPLAVTSDVVDDSAVAVPVVGTASPPSR